MSQFSNIFFVLLFLVTSQALSQKTPAQTCPLGPNSDAMIVMMLDTLDKGAVQIQELKARSQQKMRAEVYDLRTSKPGSASENKAMAEQLQRDAAEQAKRGEAEYCAALIQVAAMIDRSGSRADKYPGCRPDVVSAYKERLSAHRSRLHSNQSAKINCANVPSGSPVLSSADIIRAELTNAYIAVRAYIVEWDETPESLSKASYIHQNPRTKITYSRTDKTNFVITITDGQSILSIDQNKNVK